MIIPKGRVVWFTGLSGSGKSTLSSSVASKLRHHGYKARIVDSDTLRRGLCADLGYEDADRLENVRRLSHVGDILCPDNDFVLVAAICPYNSLRTMVRLILPDMLEIYVRAPLAVCEARDPKGLYRLARAGLLRGFTGIDAPFEAPTHPDLVCSTDQETIDCSTERVVDLLLHSTDERSGAPEGDRRFTIAVDFDGVIAEYDGWRGERNLGAPRADVRSALLQLRTDGWKIIVHTTRSHEHVEQYLIDHQVPYHEINTNSDYDNGGTKPVATVYWDDRAVCYSGNAAVDLRTIRNFRTWSGRS